MKWVDIHWRQGVRGVEQIAYLCELGGSYCEGTAAPASIVRSDSMFAACLELTGVGRIFPCTSRETSIRSGAVSGVATSAVEVSVLRTPAENCEFTAGQQSQDLSIKSVGANLEHLGNTNVWAIEDMQRLVLRHE